MVSGVASIAGVNGMTNSTGGGLRRSGLSDAAAPPVGQRSEGLVARAVGWCVLFVACQGAMGPGDQAVVLFTLALAEAASAVMLAGCDGSKNHGGLVERWPAALGQVLLRWCLFSLALVAAAGAGLLGFFASHPMAVICLAGLALLLSLLRMTAACRSALGRFGAAAADGRNLLLAGMISAIAVLTPVGVELFLGAAILGLLCLLLLLLIGLPGSLARHGRSTTASNHLCVLSGAQLVLRQTDLVLAGFILAPPAALVYLIARAMGQVVTLTLDQLQLAALCPAQAAYRSMGARGLVAAAARINLGVLLVGGGIAVTVLTAAPFVTDLAGDRTGQVGPVLFWCVLGAAAPAIFGATPLLMRAAGAGRDVGLIAVAGCVVLCAIAATTGLTTPLEIARLAAGTELGAAAVSALILGVRVGVWPGLTALLFRQIRLL